MSGFPHGLTDNPGRDYELRGSEIVAVPNRTGGGMTCYQDARDALRELKQGAYGTYNIMGTGPRLLTDSAAFSFAPHFVNALRAAYYAGIDEKNERPHSDCGVTAGVAAMMEES